MNIPQDKITRLLSVSNQFVVISLAVFSAVLVFGLFLSQPAYAQTSTKKASGTGNNLKISPLRTDLTLRPGESRTVPIYVENLESKPVTLKPIENDFVAGNDESGAPSIILSESEYAPTHSLKRYMQPLTAITVQPGERKEVKVLISVPRNASAGGYYGALRFAPANPDGSEVVNVSGSVASLIILTVPGNLTESLQVVEFGLLQNGKKVTRLSNPTNVSAMLRLENKGNVQLAPYGNLSILKNGATEPVYSVNINDIKPAALVLPDSTRKFEIPLKNLDKFGKYTVNIVLGYGTNNETTEIQKSFWIIPATYIIGGIIAAVLIVIIVIAVIVGLRSYKKRILKRARRR